MYLLIDWGNTRLKYLTVNELTEFADDKRSIKADTVSSPDDLITQIKVLDGKQVLISSVRSIEDNKQLQQRLEKTGYEAFFAKSAETNCDVQSGYHEPLLLGTDRWLTIIAASKMGQTVGIIDIGTTITLDIVNSRKHLGGQILPGESLLKNSLLNTANVKIRQGVKEVLNQFELGQSTVECVDFGVAQMIGGYLIASINQTSQNHQVGQWFITGGGGEYWSKWLLKTVTKEQASQISYKPNLVFQGLARYFIEKSIK